jgi:hypothetical protein
VLTDVSGERIASIFKIKEKNKKIRKRRDIENRCKQKYIDVDSGLFENVLY